MSNLRDNALTWGILVDVGPDGTVPLDERSAQPRVNEMLTALTGCSREEPIDTYFHVIAPSRHRNATSRVRGRQVRVAKSRRVCLGHDFSVWCDDASQLSVDFALASLTSHRKPWTLPTISDNFSRSDDEHAWREVEERFRLAFEENIALMIYTNLDDLIISTNDEFYDVVGYSKGKFIGHDS